MKSGILTVFPVVLLLFVVVESLQPCGQINAQGTCSFLEQISYDTTCDSAEVAYFEPLIEADGQVLMQNGTDVRIRTNSCVDAYARAVCPALIPRCNISGCGNTDNKPLCLPECFDVALHCGIAPNWCWSVNKTDYTDNTTNCSMGVVGYDCIDAPMNLSFCSALSINYTIGSLYTSPYDQWNVMDSLARELYDNFVSGSILTLGVGCTETFKNLICSIYFPECVSEQTLPLKVCENMCEKIYSHCPLLNLFAGDDKDCSTSKLYEHDLQKPCQELEVITSDCFIATTAFESSDNPNVVFLRKFRQDHLMTSDIGKKICAQYAQYGPVLATVVKYSSFTRKLSRMALYLLIFCIRRWIFIFFTALSCFSGVIVHEFVL